MFRLEAIDEGQEGLLSSKPNMSFESRATDEGYEEPSYLPSHFQALRDTFENNNISNPNVVAMMPINQDMQPSPSSQSSLQDGLLYESSHSQITPIQNEQYFNFQSSLQDGSMDAPSTFPMALIQSEQSNSQSLLQDGSMRAPSPTSITLIQSKQGDNAPNPMQFVIGYPTSTPITRTKLIEVKESSELFDFKFMCFICHSLEINFYILDV